MSNFPELRKGDALLIVDVQNDFCPGGALPVPNGDEVVPVLNGWVEHFAQAGHAVFATRDWHPKVTRHFVSGGGKWPPHCVQNTRGAFFHPDLKFPPGTIIVSKGMGPDEDAYSGFDGETPLLNTLDEELHRYGVKRLFVGGLATDYCVKATVLVALKLGFEVVVINEAVRAVNVQPNDGERAFAAMLAAGATILS